MTAYVDSSVLLRVVFDEPRRLRQWGEITRPLSSTLVRLECLRTIDRARLRLRLPDSEVADLRSTTFTKLAGFDLIPIDAAVLDRAAEPFATALGSLDAIHLASALLLHQQTPDLRLATHDAALAMAARAAGLEVLGS